MHHPKDFRGSRGVKWYFELLFLICSLEFSNHAYAQACAPAGGVADYTINANCSVLTITTTGNVTVSAGVTISGGAGQNESVTLGGAPPFPSSFTNFGVIDGAGANLGIGLSGGVGTLNNLGRITGVGAWPGIYNSGQDVITVLNNGGTITSVSGVGIFSNNNLANRIITLQNFQGAGNAAGPLVIENRFPENYNIGIQSTTVYGRLVHQGNPGIQTNTTVFGISSFSTTSTSILNTLFTSVLTDTTATRLGHPGVTTFSDTSNGYSFTLTETFAGSLIWNLTITACSVCSSSGSGESTLSNMTSGTSVGLRNINVTYAPVFAGGTLVLNNGDSSSLAFSVLSAGGTIMAPSSGSAILSGVFSGAGGLTFAGTGITIFSGANTYTGGTTVSSGTLSVSGSSPTGTGDVFVATGGTLMGTGAIAGNLTVAGVLKPGNSPGYLAASANVTMNTGSTYRQDIAGATQASSFTPVGASGDYSYLTSVGQFTINTGATLAPRLSNLFSANEPGYGSSIYVPALGDRFRIVTAAGGMTGRFTTITQPAELTSGTQFVAFYNVNNSNSIDLALTPTSYSTTLSSSTTNAKSVASVLDPLLGVNKVGTATTAQDSLLYAVAGQTAASLPVFAQALAGEIHAASAATLSQTTQRLQQSVLARLGDYPMAPSQINPALSNSVLTGSLSATNPSGLPTENMSSNPAVNPNTVNVTSAAVADGRAWGEIAYQRGNRASNGGGNGYTNNLYQVVTGVDAYSNAELGLKLGGGISLSNTTVAATGGNSTIQQGSLFAYGKMSVLQDYVLDGMASVGLSSTNLSRNDPTGYTGGFSSKAVMGNDALVSVGISRAFEYNDVRVTPYARLTYQYVGQSSYDEGSGAAALNIARFSGSAARGVIGVAAGTLNKDPLKDDYTYRANLAVGADTSGLLNPTLNTTLGGYSSSVTTATAGSAFVQVGLYGTAKIADKAYAYAGVSGEARAGQTLYGGSVGLRLAF